MLNFHYLPRFDLFQQLVLWLNDSMEGFRKGRHYLERNLALLGNGTDRELLRLILAKADDTPEKMQQMNVHLLLLRDIRRRGSTVTAIREAYIDRYGGFALDVPDWLIQSEQQQLFLKQLQRPERTKLRLISSLRADIARAQYDITVAAEIIAELRNELGLALLQGPYSSTHEGHVQAIEEAIASHEQALTIYRRERYPLQYAKTQMCLGAAYYQYGICVQREAIENAIDSYERALQIYTPDTFPEQWVILQTCLGNAYAQRQAGDPADNVEQSIAYHCIALQGVSATPASTMWATIQINLGDAYRQRILGTRANNLRQAMTCYKTALLAFTPQAFPREWAGIHIRIGSIYQKRYTENKEQRDQDLNCAIVCYEGALQVYTPDSFIAEYAATQVKLGNAHRLRTGRERQKNLEQAARCYQAALQVFTHDTFPIEHLYTMRSLVATKTQQQATQISAPEESGNAIGNTTHLQNLLLYP